MRSAWIGYLAAAAGVVLVTLVIGGVLSWTRLANVSMLYLLIVLATATRFGSGPAVLASLLAFLAYDWFFVDPAQTLTVADPEEWLSLLMMV
jgi:two-component system sensor histidine kinase KdpD